MDFKEKAQLVGVSVVLALAMAAGLYYLVKPEHKIFGPGDDAPIIMAGGSLTIGSEGLSFNVDSTNHQLVVADPLLKVFQIDLVDGSDMPANLPPVPPGVTGDVVVSYCKAYPCVAPKKDEVTLHFESGKPIAISNRLNNIDKAARVLLNLRTHRRKHWVMNQVTVSWTGQTPVTADCGSEGECSLIIHTCQQGTNCIAVP